MKNLLDGLTCIMMVMIILMLAKMVFPQRMNTLFTETGTRWDNANDTITQEDIKDHQGGL